MYDSTKYLNFSNPKAQSIVRARVSREPIFPEIIMSPMTKKKKKIILIPYPAQGHVTPMLKLASVLSNLSFQPVLITPEFIHRRISPPPPQIDGDGILYLSISDGLDEGAPRDFFSIERAMEEHMPPVLERLLRKMMIEDGDDVACLVADLLASWALDVAAGCGVAAAGFWPAMHATYRLIQAVPHLIRTGVISENGSPRNQSSPICLSSDERILVTANDLPWLIGSPSARVSRFKFWTRTLNRAKTLRYLLTNTFPNESGSKIQEMVCNHNNSPRVLEIGPLIMQASTISTTSFWEEDTSCLDWLDNQDEGSVIYISFGSWVSPIGEAKVKDLALTLEALRRPFLWVLGHAWRQGLPNGYLDRVGIRGMIVPWAPQFEVLRHQAVGFYLTHCGWNSTVEAIQCKKPLLCYPIAGDQFLNCAYIVDSWRIGVKMEGFGVEEAENGLREVEDEQFSWRLEKLNEKVFGKDGSSKAMSNLSMFILDLGK